MPTPRAHFDAWLLEPEGTRLEFKSARQNYQFDKLVEYCVALANEGGGTIILGVSDQRPRTIVGTQAFLEPGRTEAGLHDRLHHRIPVEELILPEGRVLLVHVPARLPGTAWQVDGRYLKRAGDGLVGMPDQELRDIFAETGPDFSALPCPGATLADLSPTAIADFRTRWATRTNDQRRLQWSDAETLTNAELIVDGQVTYAALILLGTHAALGRRLAQAEVVFEYRGTEATGPADDRVEFREGLLLFHDALWARINLRNTRQSYQDGFFRYDVVTFDEVSVREAVLNAVAHRDYRDGGNIFVIQYPRQLRLTSPGGLPPGITPDNIIEQQKPRNRLLATALAHCGLVERAGQGMNLMFERAVRHAKPLPNLGGSDAHRVHLVLDGTMAAPEFVRFLARLGLETLQTFSTWDFLTLDAIERDVPLSPRHRERIPASWRTASSRWWAAAGADATCCPVPSTTRWASRECTPARRASTTRPRRPCCSSTSATCRPSAAPSVSSTRCCPPTLGPRCGVCSWNCRLRGRSNCVAFGAGPGGICGGVYESGESQVHRSSRKTCENGMFYDLVYGFMVIETRFPPTR